MTTPCGAHVSSSALSFTTYAGCRVARPLNATHGLHTLSCTVVQIPPGHTWPPASEASWARDTSGLVFSGTGQLTAPPIQARVTWGSTFRIPRNADYTLQATQDALTVYLWDTHTAAPSRATPPHVGHLNGTAPHGTPDPVPSEHHHPGTSHLHHTAAETITVIFSGEGHAAFTSTWHQLRTGDLIYRPAGSYLNVQVKRGTQPLVTCAPASALTARPPTPWAWPKRQDPTNPTHHSR